jgi:hypothetical protein
MCIESGECHEAAGFSLEDQATSTGGTIDANSAAMSKEARAKAIVAYKRAAKYSTRPDSIVSDRYPSYTFDCLGVALRRIGESLVFGFAVVYVFKRDLCVLLALRRIMWGLVRVRFIPPGRADYF